MKWSLGKKREKEVFKMWGQIYLHLWSFLIISSRVSFINHSSLFCIYNLSSMNSSRSGYLYTQEILSSTTIIIVTIIKLTNFAFKFYSTPVYNEPYSFLRLTVKFQKGSCTLISSPFNCWSSVCTTMMRILQRAPWCSL